MEGLPVGVDLVFVYCINN